MQKKPVRSHDVWQAHQRCRSADQLFPHTLVGSPAPRQRPAGWLPPAEHPPPSTLISVARDRRGRAEVGDSSAPSAGHNGKCTRLHQTGRGELEGGRAPTGATCWEEGVNADNEGRGKKNTKLSDILVCVMCIPFTVIYALMDHWIFGDTMCKLTSYVQGVSISVSIFTLVLIAIERYQLTAKPRGWKSSICHAHWCVTLIWLFSLLLSIPFFLSYHLTDEPFYNLSLPTDPYAHQVTCVENWPSKMNQLLFTTSLFMLQDCVPLGFILICYLKTAICLHRRNGKVDRKRENENQLSGNKQVNMMLISIVVTFGVYWLPLNIFNIIYNWYHDMLMSYHHDLVFIICHLVAMVSTCINPLFCGFLNEISRRTWLVLIHHCSCFAPQERYENTAISTMHTDESRGSLQLAHIPTGILLIPNAVILCHK
ncbi:LOW QUALITY PROTEIN: neuropeptide Y receptor type 6-like [Tamandua tetradactyla]|uniref:LOW QUALITY PROTEIN: neuropeptide Y receptor type 6-like n=1 Tax=Tamandua tetradactyla TaxID=48850 RepID=UPI0040541DE9